MIDIRYETDDVVVRIPRGVAAAGYVQTFLERVRVDAMLEHSEATDEQIRALADEVDSNWWAENRVVAENIPGGANAPPGSEDQPPQPGEVEDWRALFNKIQGLPQSHAMTDADIAKEINDYRSGRRQE